MQGLVSSFLNIRFLFLNNEIFVRQLASHLDLPPKLLDVYNLHSFS